MELQHQCPSSELFRTAFLRVDWLDLLAVQGTLKSFLQHHSSKASILWCSAFFMVQFSHPYLATGETIALTIQTLVDKVMSLLFNMLSRSVVTFLPRSKHVLISWLQSPSAEILEPKKIKSASLTAGKPLTMNHKKLWKIFKEMRIPDHLTCLLQNLYACQEATVRTRHGTMD